jgi:hypothetical protein
MAADGKVYAVNGNGTLDFHCFDPATGYWTDLNRPPVGPAGKGIKRGGRLLADGSRYVYLIKGNSTLEFYRYDIFSGAWSSLTEVPAGSEGKGVKGGGDMVLVPGQGTNYIYFLKGNKTEFYRYSTAGNSWETRATAPAGAKGKWPKGSFLAYDGGSTIYAHKAATHEFYPYNVNTNAWGSVLAGMPQYSMSGKSKRSKDGAAAVWYNGSLYALKGGGTNEFWRFSPAGGWYEMDSAPYYGSTQAKKGFKAGGDLTADQNTFFAIKGNETTEFWTYTIAGGDGGQARKEAATDDGRLTIAPNPVMSGFATVRYHRGQTRDALFPMTLHVYDASGRAVLAHPLIGASATLDLRGLSAGVYLVRVTAGGVVASQRLVVER